MTTIAGVNVFEKPLSTIQILSNSEHPPRIVFYLGTYDPPHDGHRSALIKAIEVMKAQFAIIVIGENPWKPERLDMAHRFQMVNFTFKDDPQVFIAKDDKHTVMSLLQKNAFFINLMGTDCLSYNGTKTEHPCHEFCVSIRKDTTNNLPPTICNKKVTYITPEITDRSSTKIRDHLKLHPELFFNPNLPKDPLLSSLHHDVLYYILNNRLYIPHLESMTHDVVTSISAKLPDPTLRVVSLNALNKGGNFAGDLIFIAYTVDKKPICFIKAYKNKTTMHNELRALELISQAKLPLVQCPSIVWSKEEQNVAHIGQSIVPGDDMNVLWKDPSKNKEQLVQMSFVIGKALRQFHQHKRCPVVGGSLDEWLIAKLEKTEKMLNFLETKINPETVHIIKQRLNQVVQQLRENPGDHTFIHGDPNPGNFFVDLNTFIAAFIDLNDCGSFISQEGEPRGYAPFDYHHYISYIHWWEIHDPLADNLVQMICQKFAEGYGQPQDFSQTQNRFSEFFWALRTLRGSYAVDTQKAKEMVPIYLDNLLKLCR